MSYPIIRICTATLLALPLFAGQSLQLTSNTVATNSFRSISHSTPTRVEFYLHDWVTSGNSIYLADSNATGLRAILYNPGTPDNLQLGIYNQWELDPVGSCQVQLGTAGGGAGLPAKGVYVRYQHDPSGALGAARTDYCEMWDTNGIRIAFSTVTWSKENDGSGNTVTVGGGTDSRAMAFFRIHSSLLPPNSRMPVTADNTDTLLHWKFDGNLSDSSGNRYNGQMSGGSAIYVPTPNQSVISIIKTSDAPAWSNWVTVRAGQPGQLNGSSSFCKGTVARM